MTVQEVIQALRDTKSAHMLTEGATDEELHDCEEVTGLAIPGEYRTFLRFTNGALLYETEDILGTRSFWSDAETIPEVVGRLRQAGEGPLPLDLLPFYSRPGGRYTCLVLSQRHSEDTAAVVEWTEQDGIVGPAFDSFGQWFKTVLYDEYHSRYVR